MESSDNRVASSAPAEPAPTMITSYVKVAPSPHFLASLGGRQPISHLPLISAWLLIRLLAHSSHHSIECQCEAMTHGVTEPRLTNHSAACERWGASRCAPE
jgi:hypothetical protein